ncbi:MAG: ferritin family protein [Patescibacteria group bacterium]
MKTYICEICGEAHVGIDKPGNCPFCGAHNQYLKEGNVAKPITLKKIELSELSKKNLLEALSLELNAVATYNCIASKSDNYEIIKMYNRLAEVENKHADAISNVLDINKSDIALKTCSNEMSENFQVTLDLEIHASDIYARFAREAVEIDIKILFAALAVVEKDHIDLINNYHHQQ